MTVVTDMWLAPNLPGYEEVRSFYSRMAQKLAWAPGMGGMGAMMGRQAGMMKGMSQLYKEASKLEGVPVLQIVRMGGMAGGMSEADMAKMPRRTSSGASPATTAAGSAPAIGRRCGGKCARPERRWAGWASWADWREPPAGSVASDGRRSSSKENSPQQQAQTAPPAPAPERSRRRGTDSSRNADGNDDGTDCFFVSAGRRCQAECAGRLQAGRTRNEKALK